MRQRLLIPTQSLRLSGIESIVLGIVLVGFVQKNLKVR